MKENVMIPFFTSPEQWNKVVQELKAQIENHKEETKIALTTIQTDFATQIANLSGKKKKELTEPLKILRAHYLKALDHIRSSKLLEKQKAALIAEMLGTGEENTEKYLRKIGSKGSPTYKEEYYEFLVDYFEEKGLNDEKRICFDILLKIREEKSL